MNPVREEPTHNDAALDATWQEFLRSLVGSNGDQAAERKQERSKRREHEILRAALRIFARDGISRARIGEIASEAGMAISTLYEYFPSKEDLAYAIPTAHLKRFFAEYIEAVAEKTTARERLRLYLWLAADFARRNPDWARTLYLEIWPSVLVSETSVRHTINDYVRVILLLIRQGEVRGEWPAGPDPYETAAILNGSVNQTIITWLLYRQPKDLMKAIPSLIDRAMTILQPQPPAKTKAPPKATRR
jgi:AcrR family transcriptional regulator